MSLTQTILVAVIKIGLVFGGVLTAAAWLVLVERWMAAWIQMRRGPNRVGIPFTKLRLFGLGQPAADGLKFIFKEEFDPAHVNRRVYTLAPIVIMTAALAIFAVIPFGSVLPSLGDWMGDQPIELVIAPGIDVGMIYIFALSGLAVYGVILGGWASNNKYALIGGLRASSQMISYELGMGLAVLGVIMLSGSLSMVDIINAQADGRWFIFLQPLGFIIFCITMVAETKRAPFDLPEAEQEIVAGFHTEYSGMKFSMFYMGEYISMIVISAIASTLYLGGWRGPFAEQIPLLGPLYLFLKTMVFLFVFVWLRASFPRLRYDRLMDIGWKILLPLSVLNLVITAIAIVASDTGFFGLFG